MQTIKEYYLKAAQDAWIWICLKYYIIGGSEDESYGMPVVKLSRTCRFAKYTLSKRTVRIDIRCRVWNTYSLKSIGQHAPCISCTLKESVVLQAIHEFTHAVQHSQHRKLSEVEATRNEIEYAKEYYPHLFKRLEEVAS
jgi:hypothetical protein